MSLGINTSNRALRWLGTTAVTTGLFVGSLGIAGAATDHKAKPHKSSPSSAPAHRGPGIKAPGGIVQAVSASSLTVVSREGVTTTFTVNSATAVVSPTGPMTLSAVTVGTHVHVAATAGVATTIYLEPTPGADRPDRAASPHLGGQVVAVSDTIVTIADRDGFWRTINLSDSTTYSNVGVTATKSAVTVGSFVMARGSVNTDHTSLDATSVDVAPTPPQEGPGAPHGHH